MVFFPECKNPKIFSRIQIGFTLFAALLQIIQGVYSLLTFNNLYEFLKPVPGAIVLN
jgi:hypothetical protein